MRISVLLEKFKKGLNAVDRIVASKNTLPILSNVLIKTEEGQVVLSATDLEIGINYYLGGKIEGEGSITVPGKVLGSFVNSLSEEKITLESTNGVLFAKTENSEANINGMAADEFPIIPKIIGKEVLEIDGGLLKTAISQVVFSASFDESRPVLTGVYFIVGDNMLKMVATDSYRLAEKTINIPTNHKASFIIPVKTIQELYRIITGGEKIKIVVSENQVMFLLPDMDITSRIIEGDYPDYEQIIPKNFKTHTSVPTAELANTIKTASFFARENANNIKITLYPDHLLVEATSSQLGNFKSQIKCVVQGEENEVSFNARYLLDALGGVDSAKVKIELIGKINPGVLRPDNGSGVIYIIMPLRS